MKNVKTQQKNKILSRKLLRQALEETLLNSEQLEHILGKNMVSKFATTEQDYITSS